MDPWNTISSGLGFASKDTSMAQIMAAKKALQLLAGHSDLVVKLCLACAENDVFTAKDLLQGDSTLLHKLDKQGVPPLIYAVCFNHIEIVELLLAFKVDVNEMDKLVAWTPLMWATNFDYEQILERLMSYGADPLKKSTKSLKTAVDIAKKGTKTYEYFRIHGYIKEKKPVTSGSEFYQKDNSISDKVQSLNLNNDAHTTAFVSDDVFDYDPSVENITFNFNVVTRDQCLRFNTESIPAIMEYVLSLQQKYHSKPLYPSTIIFQCMRYAETKNEGKSSSSVVKDLLITYLSNIRKETNTTSGVVQFIGMKERKQMEKDRKKSKDPQLIELPKKVDVMVIGYWIAAVNHLYYFLTRDTACSFFKKYPDLLQELISCLHLLTTKLAFTMDEKLEPLVEDCILKYNSVPDTEVLYKNDWKIFKSKNKQPKTSFEEIVDVLYPPSMTDQMKPSPVKIIQILGALLYTMELYHINDLLKQQCLTYVMYWFGCQVFNSILENRQYCSRVKAMEIRLNISYIEDWLRSNNFQPFIEKGGDIQTVLRWKNGGFPDNLSGSRSAWLQHVARYNGDLNDPNDASFYYNSMSKIGHSIMQPILELTEWLQVLSSMSEQQSVIDIADNFEMINNQQMVQCIRNYNYEVDERKFSKSLKKWLKEFQITPSLDVTMFHKTDSKGREMYLNQLEVFPCVLPNTVQLLHQYGADFDHIDKRKFIAYQPNLPLLVRDEIETTIESFFTGTYEAEDEIYQHDFMASNNQEPIVQQEQGYSDFENSEASEQESEVVEEEDTNDLGYSSAPKWQPPPEASNPWA